MVFAFGSDQTFLHFLFIYPIFVAFYGLSSENLYDFVKMMNVFFYSWTSPIFSQIVTYFLFLFQYISFIGNKFFWGFILTDHDKLKYDSYLSFVCL